MATDYLIQNYKGVGVFPENSSTEHIRGGKRRAIL
jgi:hypothetical protein